MGWPSTGNEAIGYPGFVREAKGDGRLIPAIVEALDGLPVTPREFQTVVDIESKWSPAAQNGATGATGLLQWLPSTAQSLGTSTDAIKRMSAADQTRLLVRKTFGAWAPALRKLVPQGGTSAPIGDVYLAILYPALVGAPDSAVVPAAVAAANPIPGTGTALTVGDIRAYVLGYHEQSQKDFGHWLPSSSGSKLSTTAGLGTAVVAMLLIGGIIAVVKR